MSRRLLRRSTSDLIGMALSGQLFARGTWSNGGFQEGYTKTGKKRKIQSKEEAAPLKTKPFAKKSKRNQRSSHTNNLFEKQNSVMSRNDDKTCDRKIVRLRRDHIKGSYKQPTMTIKNQNQYVFKSSAGRQLFSGTDGWTMGDFNNAFYELIKRLPTSAFNNASTTGFNGFAVNNFASSIANTGAITADNILTLLGNKVEVELSCRHEIANISDNMIYVDAYLVNTKIYPRFVYAAGGFQSIESLFREDGPKKLVINNANTGIVGAGLCNLIETDIVGQFPGSAQFKSSLGVKKIWSKIMGPGQNCVLNITAPTKTIKPADVYNGYADAGIPIGSYTVVYKIRGNVGVFRTIIDGVPVTNTASNPTYLPAEIAIIESRKLTVKYNPRLPVKKMIWNRDVNDEVKTSDGTKKLFSINPETNQPDEDENM